MTSDSKYPTRKASGGLRGLIAGLSQASGRKLARNFFSLSVLQASNYILPLLILPYLISVIGLDRYGLIVFAQAMIQYLIILSDYGFNLSATKEIAEHQKDMTQVSRIVSSVFIVRSVLTLLGFVLLLALVMFIPKLRVDSLIYLLTYGLVIGNLMFPIWFFQGMERMKYVTLLAISAKLFYFVTLLLLVTTESDYRIVPLLNSLGMILAGMAALIIMRQKFGVRFTIPKFHELKNQFKRSSQFFLSRVSAATYSSLNTLVLGIVTTNEMIAYYVAAEKIFIAMRSACNPLVQTLYPFMSSRKDTDLFKRIFYLSLSLSIIVSGGVYWFSGDIIDLIFKPDMSLTAELLRLFSLIIPVVVASLLLGYPYLAALGHSREANLSITIGSLFHILLLAALYPVLSPRLVVMAVLMTESIVLVLRIRGVRKHQLWTVK